MGKGTGHFCRGVALTVANALNFLTLVELNFSHFLTVSRLQCEVKLPKTLVSTPPVSQAISPPVDRG